MSLVSNPFTDFVEAKRYDNFRPKYHDLFVNELNNYLNTKNIKINTILDLACGTGQSTQALLKYCQNVTGYDQSEAMISIAKKNVQTKFIIGSAESTPFENQSFDFINISMAYQWFKQDLFLTEVKRILKPNALMCLDNYGYTGVMIDDKLFNETYKSFDLKHLPAAQRNPDYVTESQLVKYQIELVQILKYEHNVPMNLQQFINYLMTRSNFQVLDDQNKSAMNKQLESYYKPYFLADKKLLFKGQSRLYRFI